MPSATRSSWPREIDTAMIRSRTRRALRLLSWCATVLGAVIVYTALSIWLYKSPEPPATSDAAVVLGAAVWGDRPSPVFRERIEHAITLYRGGRVRKIVFTGGSRSMDEPAEAVVARAYAAAHGVRRGDILVETGSRITEENLANAYRVGRQHGITSYVIVSDPLHMRRAMLMARDLGMKASSSPTPTTRYRSIGSRLRFLGREVFFHLLYVASRPFRAEPGDL